MRKWIQRHWRSNWAASSALETVTQQLLPHWRLYCVGTAHSAHNPFFIPCRESAAQPRPTCKEYRVTRAGMKADTTITWRYTHTHLVSMEDLKAHSFLSLTRATSSCFPKRWSVKVLKSRDLLETFLHITLTNNLYFYNRSIFFIYQTFSLALLEWNEAPGLIKTHKTFMEGFWEAVSGLSTT